jgi:hypothetical protein
MDSVEVQSGCVWKGKVLGIPDVNGLFTGYPQNIGEEVVRHRRQIYIDEIQECLKCSSSGN